MKHSYWDSYTWEKRMSEMELIAKKVYLQQTMMLQSLALPYFCFAFCWDTGY